MLGTSAPCLLRKVPAATSQWGLCFPLRWASMGSLSAQLQSRSTRWGTLSSSSSVTAASAATSLRAIRWSPSSLHIPIPTLHGGDSTAVVCFSSSTKKKDESVGGITGWVTSRRKRQEQEKYMEQMEKLSNMDRLTMQIYHDMLKEGVSGFMSNISFMQSKEIKTAKAVVEVVEKIIEVVGPHATCDDLIEMDRLQRLKVATSANKTPEEISIMVSQITNMDVMQKALRKRRLDGKPIPVDQDQMQAVIKRDAVQVMSKAQKSMLKGRQENYARRMARRKAGR